MTATGSERTYEAQIAVRLPADLLDRARRAAHEEDRPLSAVVRRALRQALGSVDEARSAT